MVKCQAQYLTCLVILTVTLHSGITATVTDITGLQTNSNGTASTTASVTTTVLSTNSAVNSSVISGFEVTRISSGRAPTSSNGLSLSLSDSLFSGGRTESSSFIPTTASRNTTVFHTVATKASNFTTTFAEVHLTTSSELSVITSEEPLAMGTRFSSHSTTAPPYMATLSSISSLFSTDTVSPPSTVIHSSDSVSPIISSSTTINSMVTKRPQCDVSQNIILNCQVSCTSAHNCEFFCTESSEAATNKSCVNLCSHNVINCVNVCRSNEDFNCVYVLPPSSRLSAEKVVMICVATLAAILAICGVIGISMRHLGRQLNAVRPADVEMQHRERTEKE